MKYDYPISPITQRKRYICAPYYVYRVIDLASNTIMHSGLQRSKAIAIVSILNAWEDAINEDKERTEKGES